MLFHEMTTDLLDLNCEQIGKPESRLVLQAAGCSSSYACCCCTCCCFTGSNHGE